MKNAIRHLHITVGFFFFLFLICMAVICFVSSKAIVITAAIFGAINFTLFIFSLIFSLCVNSGEKIKIERELSSLFGKNVKIK